MLNRNFIILGIVCCIKLRKEPCNGKESIDCRITIINDFMMSLNNIPWGLKKMY